MTEQPDQEMQPARALGAPIVLAWILLYLLLMAHGGWRWRGAGVLDFGMPAASGLTDFGAAVSTKIRQGEWWRLLLSPWLQTSLLGVVLLSFFWLSTARTLARIVGTARTWLLFVVGGASGALAHTLAHPEASLPGGAGPFDAIAAGIGAQLVWGLGSRSPQAKRVRNGALASILIVGLLAWYFTRGTDRGASVRAVVGFESMLGGLGAGMLLMVVFGPRRAESPPGGLTLLVAWLALALVAVAVAQQAPRALAAGERGETERFLRTLMRAELAASDLRDQREASNEKRQTLARRLGTVRADSFLDDYEGAPLCLAYLTAMEAYIKPVRLPYMARDPCRKAFHSWYEKYEAPLREEVGLPARFPSEHYWERD